MGSAGYGCIEPTQERPLALDAQDDPPYVNGESTANLAFEESGYMSGIRRSAGLCAALAVIVCVPSVGAWDGLPVNDFSLAVGLGFDSNPYLTPDEPYFDQNRRAVLNLRGKFGLAGYLILESTRSPD